MSRMCGGKEELVLHTHQICTWTSNLVLTIIEDGED